MDGPGPLTIQGKPNKISLGNSNFSRFYGGMGFAAEDAGWALFK